MFTFYDSNLLRLKIVKTLLYTILFYIALLISNQNLLQMNQFSLDLTTESSFSSVIFTDCERFLNKRRVCFFVTFITVNCDNIRFL